MNIVLPGGAGFIGTHLYKKLLKNNEKITIIDSLTSNIHEKRNLELPESCDLLKCDYADLNQCGQVYLNADAIVLLAAETGMGASQFNNELYFDCNTLKTAKLIDFLRANNSKAHIIVTSSCRIYGEGLYKCLEHGSFYPSNRIEEIENSNWHVTCPICKKDSKFIANKNNQFFNPVSTYAISKLAQEMTCLVNSNSSELDVTVLRLQNVYGPGQSFQNAYTGLISIFTQRLLNNNSIELYEEGSPGRDFVYVEDVADAIINCIYSREKSSEKTFDIGSGKILTIENVAVILSETINSKQEILKTKKFRVGDIHIGCADITEAENSLDWNPKVSFEDGIRNYVNWIKKQDNILDRSIEVSKELSNKGILNEIK